MKPKKRTILQVGSSKAVAMPPDWLYENELDVGMEVSVEWHESRPNEVIVRNPNYVAEGKD